MRYKSIVKFDDGTEETGRVFAKDIDTAQGFTLDYLRSKYDNKNILSILIEEEKSLTSIWKLIRNTTERLCRIDKNNIRKVIKWERII